MERILQLLCFSFIAGLTACAETEKSNTYSYTAPSKSSLSVLRSFPNRDDVCVLLNSNSLIEPFEVEGHFIIACPKHETGAIADRKALDKAVIVGDVKNWVIMRVPEFNYSADDHTPMAGFI